MRRLHKTEELLYLMSGTESLSRFLDAFAESLGETLPKMTSMESVEVIWNRLDAVELRYRERCGLPEGE